MEDGRLMNRDGSRLELYRTAFVGEFGLGAVEIGGLGAAGGVFSQMEAVQKG